MHFYVFVHLFWEPGEGNQAEHARKEQSEWVKDKSVPLVKTDMNYNNKKYSTVMKSIEDYVRQKKKTKQNMVST